MVWLMILGLAISSSIDNLGVGITYGIRGIRIRILSNVLISVICFLFSAAGIYFGQWVSKVLPGIFPILVGAFLLTIIGIRIILLAMPRRPKNVTPTEKKGETAKGLSGILKNPEKVDWDQSGDIGWAETIVLGIALSANALTSGLGAGLLGLPPLLIAITAAIASFITVWLGVLLGSKVAHIRIGSFSVGQFGTLISGILLLVIAANSFF
ncbi:sporulation membrane protein YtaF [Paenibacillus sp. HJL G12]|uniref:Sporulation membrane protein YtaF n=1 Tax=Paenibacillus dendrobii TaxID=2691084 RepID=A0A7X3IGJ6_9BACL|nr:sporulation membrane protein YtaF [Paenibacillus dendrobii]MWV43435.1 sporulation membrane protein YtaF [Paenibacillus dendrobii]